MEKPHPALRRTPFVLLAATLVACSGGGAPTTPDEAPTPATFRALPGVPEYCRIKDLSGDGRVAVGRCDARAVRWVDGEPIVIDVPRDPVPVSAVYVYEAWQVSFDGSSGEPSPVAVRRAAGSTRSRWWHDARCCGAQSRPCRRRQG